jgi:hypothetical protein
MILLGRQLFFPFLVCFNGFASWVHTIFKYNLGQLIMMIRDKYLGADNHNHHIMPCLKNKERWRIAGTRNALESQTPLYSQAGLTQTPQ